MAMTQVEIRLYAQNAGLRGNAALIASAIAMAESGGNPNAHNAKPPDDSYGLWQINMLGGLGPARRAQFGLRKNADLFDPKINARAMSEISKNGQNFSPWTTYTSGAYRQYMDGGAGGLPNIGEKWDGTLTGGLRPPEAISDTVDAAKQGVAMANKAGVWVSDANNWVRVGYVVGGGLVVLVGLYMVLNETGPGKAAMSAIKTGAKVAATKKVSK